MADFWFKLEMGDLGVEQPETLQESIEKTGLGEVLDALKYHEMIGEFAEAQNDKLEKAKNAKDRQPGCPLFLLTPETELILPAYESHNPKRAGCPNSTPRPDLWLKEPVLGFEDKELGFLDQLGHLCLQAKIRNCTNTKCSEARKRMESAAPKCDWSPFRRWALMIISCQTSISPQKQLTMAFAHLVRAGRACVSILREFADKGSDSFHPFFSGPPSKKERRGPIELLGVCDIISWIMIVQNELVGLPSNFGNTFWNRKFLPKTLTLPGIERSIQAVEQIGICKNRLWNLVNLSDRQEADLPHFINAINSHKESFKFNHGDHTFCTPSKCQGAHMDSTRVEQLHKCLDRKCDQRVFKVNLLEAALETGNGTAWSRIGPYLNAPNDPYIAISHVWSDGTGVGVKNAGCVNDCLFNYFAKLAETLGCTGIWWDALSVPQESKARSKALSKLHTNYSNAQTTVVHDNYLINFEWRDDGSPCLALVLSSWFTRGWTALELIMSKNIKVLYKDPNGGSMPLIKDLDKDILARKPYDTTRVHWLVSGFIRRLRKPIKQLGDLLAVLTARSTSWPRDRTVIAALLLDVPNCDFTRTESEITRDILKHVGAIPFESLFHGKVTMSNSGPFSWCVATLDDIRIDLSNKLKGLELHTKLMTLDKQGAVIGGWNYRRVTRDDILNEKIVPYGDSVAVRVKINAALRHWKNCLLLWKNGVDTGGMAILVTTVGITHKPIIECRYIGAMVIEKLEEDSDAKSDNSSEIDSKVDAMANGKSHYWDHFRIGNDEGKKEVRASRILRCLNKAETIADDIGERSGPDEDGFDSEGIFEPEKLSDYEPSSDDDPTDLNAGQSRSPHERDDNKKPWYLKFGATKYQRPVKDTVGEWDVDPFGSAETKMVYFSAAVERNIYRAIRHLILCGPEFSPSRNPQLVDNLKKSSGERLSLKSLLLVYLELGMAEDALCISKIVVDECTKTLGKKKLKTLREMYTLGNLSLQQRDIETARSTFRDILSICKKKNSGFPQFRVERAVEKADHTFKVINSVNDDKVTRWLTIELDTLTDLILLNAEENQITEAKIFYIQATNHFGKNPHSIYAFDGIWFKDDVYVSAESLEKAAQTWSYILRRVEGFNGKIHKLTLITALNLAIVLERQKKYHEARNLYERAMYGFPYGHILRFTSVHRLAIVSTHLGLFEEAKTWYDLALGAAEKYGPNHYYTSNVLASYGMHYLVKQNPIEAEKMFRQALGSSSDASHRSYRPRIIIKRELAKALAQQGNVRRAEEMFQHTLAILKEKYPKGNEIKWLTSFELGLFYLQQNKFLEAEEMLQSSFEGYKSASEVDPEMVLKAAWALGRIQNILCKVDKAERMLRRAHTGFKELLGIYHTLTLESAQKLGSVYLKLGKFADAEELCLFALKGREKVSGVDDLETLMAAQSLSEVYLQQWKLSLAKEYCQRSLSGHQKILGKDNFFTLNRMIDIGVIHIKTCCYEEAEQVLREAIAGYRRVKRDSNNAFLQDASLFTATLRLGECLVETGKFDDAKANIQYSLDGFEKSLGTMDSLTLEAALSLGNLQTQSFTEAERLIQRALKGFDQIDGPYDIGALNAAASLGYLYMKDSSRAAKAEPLIYRAVVGYEKRLIADHPDTLKAKHKLGVVYMMQGKKDKANKLLDDATQGFGRRFGPDHTLALKTLLRLQFDALT